LLLIIVGLALHFGYLGYCAAHGSYERVNGNDWPAQHVSVGVHQSYGECGVHKLDLSGMPRHVYICEEELTQLQPQLRLEPSAEELLPLTLSWRTEDVFTFRCNTAGGSTADVGVALSALPGNQSQWYPICGARSKTQDGATSSTRTTWSRDALIAIGVCAALFTILAAQVL
jgi:hypothetical protein